VAALTSVAPTATSVASASNVYYYHA
jgi:hypothetical protein